MTAATDPPPRHETFIQRLRRTKEGSLLLVGFLLVAAIIGEIVLVALWDFDIAAALAVGTLFEVFAGREVGIPISLTGGAPPWLVAQMSFTQDIAAVALVYPLFLWLLHRYHDRDNMLMRRVRRIEAGAAKHERYVHRWGPLGIFAFMLVPFAVNGPLIGAMLGRLAGIRTRYLIAPVLAATAIAALAWTFAFDALKGVADRIDRRLVPAITILILAFVVLGTAWSEWREATRERRFHAGMADVERPRPTVRDDGRDDEGERDPEYRLPPYGDGEE